MKYIQSKIRVCRHGTEQGLVNETVCVVENVLNRHGQGKKDVIRVKPVHGLHITGHVLNQGSSGWAPRTRVALGGPMAYD